MKFSNLLYLSLLLLLAVGTEPKTQKRRRSLSRRPVRSAGTDGVNILFVRSTSVDVGFNYIQGAKRFFVSAREWVDGESIGNEADSRWLPDQARQATLRNLNPGREYIILVQAWSATRKVGLQARTTVRMSQQCYVCNGKPTNEGCQGTARVFDCPHDKDACLNEVRYSKGVPKITKRCAQWRPELGKQVQNGKDVTTACTGRENIKDAACKCMCRSNLCNEMEMPCINECFKELPIPENSYMRCSKGEKIGSVCRWFCIPGYKIKGRRTSECRRDRTWSVLIPPECVIDRTQHTPINLCPTLEPPENSYMSCTNENKPFSTCTFTCYSQYLLKGSATRTCDGGTSKWSGEQPTCAEIQCSVIAESGGLSKECTNGENVGSVCEFACPSNKKFVGKSSLTCLPGGRWSSTIPLCTAPDCTVEPKLFSNVLMECSAIPNRDTGRVCHFSCEEGYVRSGAQSSFCYRGNSWTNASPTCRRLQCRPNMYAPTNGFVRCSERSFFGSTCAFSCIEGYALMGATETSCGIDGKWSTLEVPTCKKIKCPEFRKFNGKYSCNNGQNFGSVCRFSCDRGFGFSEGTITKVKCVQKTADELEVTRPGGTLGKWDGPLPKCIIVGCPKLGRTPDHATMKCTNTPPTRQGTICTYTCAAGYILVGSARTTCVARSDGSAQGDWSSPPPVCERVTCEALPEVSFGTVRCTDDNYAGSECTVECDYGRFVFGKKTISCTVDGSWSHKLAQCRLISCTGTPTLKNGVYNCGDFPRFTFNHECEASCNSGFELSAPGAAVCGIRGSWLTSEELVCKDVNECEALDADGRRTNGGCEQTCINTIGSYRCECEENYKLNQDGKTCRILICPSLEAVLKGRIACTNTNRIGSSCSLRCIPGFETSDVNTVTCMKEGTWDKKMGSCTRISCPPLEIPAFGFMECNLGYKFGSDCDFECYPGFELRGKPSTRCGANGKWTSQVPVCERKICDVTFLTINNAIVKCSDDNKFESMCEASCEEGYELELKANQPELFTVKIHCLEDATWSQRKPNCIKKRCSPGLEELVTTRTNGVITCTDDDLLGSSCELLCDKGYQVEGNHKTKCIGDAVWSKNLGICKKIQCPMISAPTNGQMICTEDASFESKCLFNCNEGYEMEGEESTDCTHDRTWTNKSPVCHKIACTQSFLKLLKGSVHCTEGSFFGSVCEYRCDPGYEFADTRSDIRKSFGVGLDEEMTFDIIRLSCQATGIWGGEKPVCVRHECIAPTIVMRQAEPNGNIQCSNGDKFESVCELSCNEGYEITDGRASTQCQEDRSWAPRLGRCTRIRCPMFQPLVDGAFQCTNFNFFESRCLFACYPGYKLIGPSLSYCQSDRTFTHDLPVCEKIQCPITHVSLKYGNATCSDGAKFESECIYTCNPGYEMVFNGGEPGTEESVVLKCLATGEWGGRLPTCRRKQCSIHDGGIAKARLNGNVHCTEKFWFQSVCTVECHPGFKLVGASSTTCTSDADWDPPLGFCERRTCPAITTPSHGSMECSNENRFESICKFNCDYGYKLIGYDKTQCLEQEYFSNAPPDCKEIICPIDFLQLSNGFVTCTDENKLASRCQYECDAGYQLTRQSADTLECLNSQSWDGSKPQCERKVCPRGDSSLIRAAEFGTLTCTDSNKFESICSVTCYPGYRLTEGGAFTECRADQEWGPDLGYCTKITCDDFDPFLNGTIECTDALRYQSVCSFKCDPGFELSHNRTSTCQADKKFSVNAPKCIKVACPSYHTRIWNGQVHCTDGNKFGSVCKYECNKGFERVSGSASAQCLADRTWDADKTGCERITCDGNDLLIVKARENGQVRCTSHYYYESVCILKCNKGYELTGLAVGSTKCNEFAQWDGELGYCTRVLCAEYEAPENGNMTCSNQNRYESECVFICHTGYEMNGESRATCLADRSWTNKSPTCEKIECSADNMFLDNGSANCTEDNKFLSVCWYGCDPGYEMDEDVPYAMCTSSRAWTRNKPTCIKRECNYGDEMITKALQNGVIQCSDGVRYESVCKLLCDEGYEMHGGKGEIECLDDATWDEEIGHCERIRCKQIETPLNSKMQCTEENKYESVCTFECEEGYELEGESETVCLANGTFSNDAPYCVKSQCAPDYLDLPFGIVDCSDRESFQSVCTYQCMVGYRMSGGGPDIVKSECLSSRLWSVEIPICEKRTCPYDAPHLLKALEHGNVDCTEGNRFGSVCTVECDIGYELVGQHSTECSNLGSWTNPIGYCEKIQCEGLMTPSDAIKSCTDKEFFNSSCIFSCEGGYTFTSDDFVLEEEITLTCEATRTWTSPGSPPQCSKSSCPADFLNLENGDITCSDEAYYGSQCLFKCDEGYELLEPGDDFDVTTIIVTCLANATWDTTNQPMCKKVICEPDLVKRDKEMEHGNIKCTDGLKFESKCSLSCHNGFQVAEGSSTTECLSDRTWAPQIGYCQKISCPALEAPSDSSLLCSDDFRFKSKCKVICRPGFEIYDPENDYDESVGLECKADGNWCGDVPTCTRIKCPEENVLLEGGAVNCTKENLFESECVYTCHAGYQMTQGQADTTTCTAHMTWSNPKPTCEKRRCPANENSIKEAEANGQVICTDENKFDSQCELHCAQGFELSGETFTTCQHDGEWSNGIGLCNKIRCGEVEVPSNAKMSCSDSNRYESFCTFACETGYMLTATSVKAGNGIVCQADGKWDGEIIQCEKITCPAEGYTRIESGEVRCNDTNRFLSRCLFECDEGHELKVQIDTKVRTSVVANCTERGFWDVPEPPKCKPIECDTKIEEMEKNLENGFLRCTKGSEFRSQCRVRCANGYELVDGDWMTFCGNDRKWGPKLGSCQKKSCTPLEIPENARMVCDDDFRYMSQCVFDCLPGYKMRLKGKNTGTVTCRADGNWIGLPPTCQKAQCDVFYLKLKFGEVHCSDRNFYNSECEFVCDQGHELEGASSKLGICREDGTWSIEKPVCQVKTCNSAFAANGYMNCTGSDYDAVCRLTCEEGHTLVGSDTSTCAELKNGQTKWIPPLGTCNKVRCSEAPVLSNGFIQCSDKNRFRSVCYSKCNRGYEVTGVTLSTRCLADGTWTNEFQLCERVTCDRSYLDVEYGSVTAGDENNYGSTLTFTCPPIGYKFTGNGQVTCLDNGKWNRAKPICEKVKCPPINIPNGGVFCTGRKYNDYESRCSYVCNNNFERIGSDTTECQLDGTWSNPPPYCKGHCDVKFDLLVGGDVECTNSHYHHSRCTFACGSTKTIYGNDFLTCKENGRWDGTPPCCASECIPNAKMDLFLVFHSSTNTRYNEWNRLLRFATRILDNFNIGDDNVLAGALRYHRDIDERGEIPIGKFKNKSDLQRAIEFMTLGGWGTNTGKALEHIVTDSIMQPGNRDDVSDNVILFVDDASQDDVTKAAEKLQANNITVYVVGLETPSKNLNLDEIKSISSRPWSDHITIIQGGFNRLPSDELAGTIAQKLCENPCRHDNSYVQRFGDYTDSHTEQEENFFV